MRRGGPRRRPSPTSRRACRLPPLQKLARYWATEYDWRKVRGPAQRRAELHHRDRRTRHPLHSRALEARERVAASSSRTAGPAPSSSSSSSSSRSPIRRRMAEPQRTPSTWSFPRCRATASRGSPPPPAGGPNDIARAWTVLMKRLGYTRFVAQGGDWGAIVVDLMGVQAPPELLGIHTNMAERLSSRYRRGGLFRRAGAGRSLRRREGRLRATELRLCEGHRLRLPDGAAAADAVRNRGFARRPGGVFPRSRRAQLASSSRASSTDSPRA